MFIVKDGYIYVGVSLLLAAIVYYFFGAVWAVIPVVLALYFAYFFRDFHRVTPYDPNILYSPADGTVMGVDEIFDDEYLNEPATDENRKFDVNSDGIINAKDYAILYKTKK